MLPSITIQLTDIKEDKERTCHDREVKQDKALMTAEVEKGSLALSLYYTISILTGKTRDDRLLLGRVICLFMQTRELTTAVLNKTVYIGRDIGFGDESKQRQEVKSLDIAVKTRIPGGPSQLLPLVGQKVLVLEP